ncbi:uncharacterized protein LOC116145143 [Pistacia vera]|uniref:uncharacterized protein LOC116145143 n=1 Tax=Pistacia vera TaxID=55513 RepID=UPI001263880E|nr:uncharacterized protein LOC116145143 [Pistacia vera]
MRKLFWAVSKAANRPDFVKAMGSVKDVDEGAYKWLLENEPGQWSRHAFDTTAKSDHITNDMSECFNSRLGEDWELPILSLLELYLRRVMKRLQCRLKAGTEWITPLPPVVHRKINKMIEAARNVKVWYPGSDEFEVDDENANPCKTHVLVLGKQLCDCGMWQLSRIPCVHAIACLLHKNISNYEHHVDLKLRDSMYLQTYAYMVHPVPNKTSWPERTFVPTTTAPLQELDLQQTCPKLQVQGVNQVNNAMGNRGGKATRPARPAMGCAKWRVDPDLPANIGRPS